MLLAIMPFPVMRAIMSKMVSKTEQGMFKHLNHCFVTKSSYSVKFLCHKCSLAIPAVSWECVFTQPYMLVKFPITVLKRQGKKEIPL